MSDKLKIIKTTNGTYSYKTTNGRGTWFFNGNEIPSNLLKRVGIPANGSTIGLNADDTTYYTRRGAIVHKGKIIQDKPVYKDSNQKAYKKDIENNRMVNRLASTEYSRNIYNIPYDNKNKILYKGKYISGAGLDSMAYNLGKFNGGVDAKLEPNKKVNKVSLAEAVGLPLAETIGGTSLYGNGVVGNENYLRTFGYIPAELYANDYRYTPKTMPHLFREDAEPIDRNTPPLVHALGYYSQRLYNKRPTYYTDDNSPKVVGEKFLQSEQGKAKMKDFNYWYNKGLNDAKNVRRRLSTNGKLSE